MGHKKIVNSFNKTITKTNNEKRQILVERNIKKQDYTSAKNLLDKITKLKFESTFIFAPKNTEAHLTDIYGNWKTLPPIEERKPAHHERFEISLNHQKRSK